MHQARVNTLCYNVLQDEDVVMPTRENKSVSFTPEQAAFVDACVTSGLYQSVSEVVREGLRLLERQERRRLLEKWLYEDLSEAEKARLDPALIAKARKHFQGLLDEGLRAAEEQGWIDGEKAMRRLRGRLSERRTGR